MAGIVARRHVDCHSNTGDPLVPNNYSPNYGPQGADRRQTMAINYSYHFPKAGTGAGISEGLGLLI
jgi:hypothetical protein